MSKKLKKKKGFTLIELIIVIAILGILALIAIPKFGSAQKDAKIKADVATAKTIADTTATLVAKGDINLPTDDTLLTTEQLKKVEEKMQGGKLPTPQSKEGAFTVKLDEEGNVTVLIGSAKFYPWEKKTESTTPGK